MFLKDDVIHRFRVLKYTLMDNGFEWSMEFDQLCKNYGIIHQYITPQWFICNGMVEWLVKMLKHGLNVLSTTFEHHKIGMPNYLNFCLNINVEFKQVPNSVHICC